jgi:hypothetical protein
MVRATSACACNCLFPAFWSFLFTRHLCTTRVVVIIYIHKLMLIRILSSDWSISIHVPSKLKKNRMHFYSIQVRSSFLIQVSCVVCTIKKLEFKKLEWRLGCKTGIVYTGLKPTLSTQYLIT